MSSKDRLPPFYHSSNQLPDEVNHTVQHLYGNELFAAVSKGSLEPHLTSIILVHYHKLALELCARWVDAPIGAVVCAFGRILSILPKLAHLAQQILTSLSIDDDLLHGIDLVHSSNDAIKERLLAVFRLLNFDNITYAKLVRPSKLQAFLHHDDRAVRFLAVRVLCLYLHASDSSVEKLIDQYLGPKQIFGSYEGSSIDYFFLSIWERDRHRVLATELVRVSTDGDPTVVRQCLQDHESISKFSANVVNVQGTLLLRQMPQAHGSNPSADLVPTATSLNNVKQLGDALIHDQPILLQGLPGSGKTYFVQYLSQALGQAESMVKLHLNSQTDAKMLVGLYTTGQKPGSFQWQPGPLTRAAIEGRWVLIEDIDRAPTEIVSVLLPLIERRELLIPSRGEKIKAAPGFRLIATIRTHLDNLGKEVAHRRRMLGDRFWRIVPVQPLQSTELQEVVSQHYPILGEQANSMIHAYENLRSLISTAGSSTIFARARQPTTRELLKWCRRAAVILDRSGHSARGQAIRETTVDEIFLDGVDSFAESLEQAEGKEAFVALLAESLHIDSQRRDHILKERLIKLKTQTNDHHELLVVGRGSIPRQPKLRRQQLYNQQPSDLFALNRYSLRLLEQITVATHLREPVLLVGDTGIGKTTAIQYLARSLGHKLHPLNLSQQSEVSDLLGGFKPVNARSLAIPLKDEFDQIFRRTFAQNSNEDYLKSLGKSVAKGQWKRAVKLWKEAIKRFEIALAEQSANGESTPVDDQGRKRRKVSHSSLESQRSNWLAFAARLEALEHQISNASARFSFAFVEGKLVKAVREGDWVLLDEINLATSETLECLAGLIESGSHVRPSILITESGKLELVQAHSNFRIFAAMNPSTDTTKRDLPMSIRSRFTEIFVSPPDKDRRALSSIVSLYLENVLDSSASNKTVQMICELYFHLQSLVTQNELVDGNGQRPHYSLRTLTRALGHSRMVASVCSFPRALYEGFCMCFITCLSFDSATKVEEILKIRIFGDKRTARADLKQPLRPPKDKEGYLKLSYQIEPTEKGPKTNAEQFWVRKGPQDTLNDESYIITPFIARNLQNLIRSTSSRRYPVLIQGPTSAGKTSIVEYLARRTGHKFVRINNHEHTDLQEYLGSYISAADGQLVFQDGILVQALRNGHWVVLDELNLAPSDVLEALNRLLDDNRELLVPETQEIVTPHPDFMLFATQNPPGLYGGRKVLSQAFRNRFLELHFDEIPVAELNIILSRRSSLPESWCSLIVEAHKELLRRRQASRVFEQDSFATLRDLFRWAFRGGDRLEDIADTGFMLLAEKARTAEDREVVRDVITKIFSRKGVKINIDETTLYAESRCPGAPDESMVQNRSVVWSPAMRRLFVLVHQAITHNEAVLLVGATGSGKTTVCQIITDALKKSLHIVNAHQNTETGDLIGAQRPLRNRSVIEQELYSDLFSSLTPFLKLERSNEPDLSTLLAELDGLSYSTRQSIPHEVLVRIEKNRKRYKALFEWSDGSIVQAMKEGQFFLLDEISLADDSVLERLNSVLDPARSITLAEKGSDDSVVTAQSGFQFFATMNPGGDYGKKELSPALRNRFTEIWVPPVTHNADIVPIVAAKLPKSLTHTASRLVDFARWFGEEFCSFNASTISIRDLLAWTTFIRAQNMAETSAIVHGAAMVYIDTLGANPAALIAVSSVNDLEHQRDVCLNQLSALFGLNAQEIYRAPITLMRDTLHFQIGPFRFPMVKPGIEMNDFSFEAPTTRLNAMRVARAMQLPKPILLEGNPGVGKTSLVVSLAKALGIHLTRINLSEQTDLIDLFGSDTPVEGEEAGIFAWQDAPFLTAMKNGTWALLDEMNLASQSILEGLNACLDHRGEVYIAELDHTFPRHPNFRLFAAQNPHSQGGGRKGLPSSFVNRFTVVYADVLSVVDMEVVCAQSFPELPEHHIKKVVSFISNLDKSVVARRDFGLLGSPWEFNLRDAMRWLQLSSTQANLLPAASDRDHAEVALLGRFRSQEDRDKAMTLFTQEFGEVEPTTPYMDLRTKSLQVGVATLNRCSIISGSEPAREDLLRARLPFTQSLMLCIHQKWPVLLVGESAAGKSTLLRTLADALGMFMETFSLSPDMDANDLIGGFEQADAWKSIVDFHSRLHDSVRARIVSPLRDSDQSPTSDLTALLHLSHLLEKQPQTRSTFITICDFLNELGEQGRTSFLGFESLAAESRTLQSDLENAATAKFEWSDGILVRAMQKGQWLVLDNANLCSPSVLDRLNSLLEPNGNLTINEHSQSDGTARELIPHPDFRIFLTMDPANGEVSRAMRNRAVELFLFKTPTAGNLDVHKVSTPSRYEASIFRFEQCISLVRADVPFRLKQETVRYALEQLSMRDVSRLQTFTKDVIPRLLTFNLEETLDNAVSDFAKVEPLYCSLREGISRWLAETESQADTSHDLQRSLTLLPIINEPSAAFAMRKAADSLFSWTAISHMHEILVDVAQMTRALTDIRPASTTLGDMTPLQMSTIAEQIPGRLRESTRSIAPFLDGTCRAIVKWVKDFAAGSTTSASALFSRSMSKPHDGLFPVFDCIHFMIRFWWTVFEHCSTIAFEDASLNALVQQGQKSIEQANFRTDIDLCLKASLLEQFAYIQRTSKSETGQSMEEIWKAFRPPNAGTWERLEQVRLLKDFTEQFDRVVLNINAPLKQLITVRGGLTNALALAMSTSIPVQNLINTCQSELSSVSVSEPGDFVKPFFIQSFETICQLFDLSQEVLDDSRSHLRSERLAEFELLACRNSLSDLSLSNHSKGARVLRSMCHYAGSMKPNLGPLALNSAYPLLLLEDLKKSSNISLGNVDLLRRELPVLAKGLAMDLDVLGEDQFTNLHSTTNMWLSCMLQAHGKLVDQTELELLWSNTVVQMPSEISEITYKLFAASGTGTEPTVKALQNLVEKSMRLRSTISASTPSEHFTALGDFIVELAVTSLRLYLPSIPFDPQACQEAEATLHERQQSALRTKLDAIVWASEHLFGARPKLRSQDIQGSLDRLGSLPTSEATARPPGPRHRLSYLYTQFRHALRIADQTVEQGRRAVHTSSEIFESIDQLISNLEEASPGYEDLTFPAVCFLKALKLGLFMTAKSCESPMYTDEICDQLSSRLPYLACGVDISRFNAISVSNSWPARNKDSIHELNVRFVGLDAYVLGELTPPAMSVIYESLSHYYKNWKAKLSYDQKVADKKASAYHYRGDQEEEKVFEDELEAFFRYATDGSDQAETYQGSAVDGSAIAKLHISIFLEKTLVEDNLGSLLHVASNIFMDMVSDGISYVKRFKIEALFPLLLRRVEKSLGSLDPKVPDAKNFSVYSDPYIKEAQKATELTRRVRRRFEELRDSWPEQAAIQECLMVCDEFLAFKHTEPIMKLLTKLEKLHATIAEWQSVASREYSANSLYDELTKLIISWRQIELSSWQGLLSREFETVQEEALSWWYVAYENVFALPLQLASDHHNVTEHVPELIATLETFLRASTVGQFRQRLLIVKSLAAHLKLETSRPQLYTFCSGINNCLIYFERFLPQVSDQIGAVQKKLGEEIQTVIRLASWKDTNPESLRQSAKASHRRLFKIVRKLREALHQPVNFDQAKLLFNKTLHDDNSNILPVADTPSFTAAENFQSHLEAAFIVNRPPRFQNVKATVRALQSRLSPRQPDQETSAELLTLVDNLNTEVERLRRLTPATLREDNKATAKHLTTQKRVLFLDTLKRLRHMGLKSNVASSTLISQDSLPKLLSKLPSLLNVPSEDALGESDWVLLRAFDMMPGIRMGAKEHHTDLNSVDVSRSIGYLESLLNITLDQRKQIQVFSDVEKGLNTVLSQFRSLWKAGDINVELLPAQSSVSSQWLGKTIFWLPVLLEGTVRDLETQSSFGALDFSQLISRMGHYKEKFFDLKNQFRSERKVDTPWETSSHAAIRDHALNTLQDFQTEVESMAQAFPEAKSLLLKFTQTIAMSDDERVDPGASTLVRREELETSLLTATDVALGAAQDVASIISQATTSAEDPNWLLRSNTLLINVLQSFCAPNILQKFSSVVGILARVNCMEKQDTQRVIAMIVTVLPIFEQYVIAFREWITRYSELFHNTALALQDLSKHFTTILSSGFCKPQEASEDTGQADDKLESGTGLGEGGGEENISKEIGDDEDLSELAQQDEERSGDNNAEKSEDAVDIKDQLAGGQGEDVVDQDEAEESESGEEHDMSDSENETGEGAEDFKGEGDQKDDNEQQAEDTTGGVDDMNPSAVDEKIWDDPQIEADNDKDGSREAGKKNKNEQLAGDDHRQPPEGSPEPAESGDDSASGSESGMDEADDVKGQGPDESAPMDPHAKEEQILDLPDDLQLDGDKDSGKPELDSDVNMDDLSDEENGSTSGQDPAEQNLDETEESMAEVNEVDGHAVGDNDDSPSEKADDDVDINAMDTTARDGAEEESYHDAGVGPMPDSKDEQKKPEAGDQTEAGMGLEQPDDEMKDPQSNARQQDGVQSQPNSRDMERSGDGQKGNESKQSQEGSRDQDTMRKLGDTLEKWYRQQQRVHQASTKDDESSPDTKDTDMADVEFEHLPEEGAASDAQALDASNAEQQHLIDEKMAVDMPNNSEQQPGATKIDAADEQSEDETSNMDLDHANQEQGQETDVTNELPQSFIGADGSNTAPDLKFEAEREISPEQNPELTDTLNNMQLTPDLSELQSSKASPLELWQKHVSRTHDSSLLLTSHLRLILEPTTASRLRGDFRTGKRLNMKRIIPYIASQYKRDKIWLRRTLPSKRNYQILLAVDDSKSMIHENVASVAEGDARAMAFDTVALVSQSLSMLEVGQVGVVAFAEEVKLLHALENTWNHESGARVLAGLQFQGQKTDVKRLVERSLAMLGDARSQNTGSFGEELWQVVLAVGDGICEDHESIKRLLIRAREERVMFVFIIIDAVAHGDTSRGAATATNTPPKSSIMDLESVSFVPSGESDYDGGSGGMKVERKKYMDSFPFAFYLVVRDIKELPSVLATALRQWFAEVVGNS